MPYDKTAWLDRQVEKPLTFTQKSNGDGTITLTPAEGTIVQPGTPLSSANLNNLETQYEKAMADIKPVSYLIPSLYNGWQLNGTGATRYYKDADDVVHLDFCLSSGAIAANNAFIIVPAGYRPNSRILRLGYCDASGVETTFMFIVDSASGNVQSIRNLPANSLIVGSCSYKAGN